MDIHSMNIVSMDNTNTVMSTESTPIIVGVKRSRGEKDHDAGRDRVFKLEERREPMAIGTSHEEDSAASTSDPLEDQQSSSVGAMIIQAQDTNPPSSDSVFVAAAGRDTTPATQSEANAVELVTFRSVKARVPPPSEPATGSNDSAPEASCMSPTSASISTGGVVQSFEDSCFETSAVLDDATLASASKNNHVKQAAPVSAGQRGHVGVKKCQVCEEKDSRYCCPRCGKLTCSLSCCVRHKKEDKCNGQRDKVGFVGLKDFTDRQLRSDFNFLEDALRCVDGGRRDLCRRPGVLNTRMRGNFNRYRGRGRGRGRGSSHQGQGKGTSLPAGVDGSDNAHKDSVLDVNGGALGVLADQNLGWLPGRAPMLQRLVKEAALRGTRLLLMPDGMAKREGNTTIFEGLRGRGGGGRRREGGTKSSAGWNRHNQTSMPAVTNGSAITTNKKGRGGKSLMQQEELVGVESGSNHESTIREGADDPPQRKGSGGCVDLAVQSIGAEETAKDTEGHSGGVSLPSPPAKVPPRQLLEIIRSSRHGAMWSTSPNSNGGARTGISWKVEWVFCESAASAASGGSATEGIRVTDKKVAESCLLHEALSEHLTPRPGNASLRHRLRSFAKAWAAMTSNDSRRGKEASVDQDHGRAVHQAGNFRLFLQRVPCAAKTPLYWEVDCWESLGEALKGKTVIEFPTIYVTLVGAGLAAFRTLVSEVPVDAGRTNLMDEVQKVLTLPEQGESDKVGDATGNLCGEKGLETPEETEGPRNYQGEEDDDDDDDGDDDDDDDDNADDDEEEEDDDDDEDNDDDDEDEEEGELQQ